MYASRAVNTRANRCDDVVKWPACTHRVCLGVCVCAVPFIVQLQCSITEGIRFLWSKLLPGGDWAYHIYIIVVLVFCVRVRQSIFIARNRTAEIDVYIICVGAAIVGRVCREHGE